MRKKWAYGSHRGGGKPARTLRPTKTKTLTIRGVTYERGLSPRDVVDAPTVLPGYVEGKRPSESIDKKVARRRAKLEKAVRGPGGFKARYSRPKFYAGEPAEKRPRRKLLSRPLSPDDYRPTKRGNKRHSYYFYPVFEWVIVKPYDQSDRSQQKQIAQVDAYGVLKRYFVKATKGSRATWAVRPPSVADRFSAEYVIRQTLGSYLKHGLNKKQLRQLIQHAEARLNGYAIVVGVRGVWRSPHSEQAAFREVAKLQKRMRAESVPFSAARKPKRSRKV